MVQGLLPIWENYTSELEYISWGKDSACLLIGGGEVTVLRGELERLYMRRGFRFCPIFSMPYLHMVTECQRGS